MPGDIRLGRLDGMLQVAGEFDPEAFDLEEIIRRLSGTVAECRDILEAEMQEERLRGKPNCRARGTA